MPNSVLWVFLIVVWLFVLVPMVLRGRPAARTSTKAAAQTRVVHRGGSRSAASRRAATQARSERAAKRLAERRAAEKEAAEEKAEVDKAEVEKAEVEKVDAAAETVDTEAGDADILDAEVVEDDVLDAEVTDDDVAEDEADNDDSAETDDETIDAEIVEDDDEDVSHTVLRADAESPLEVTDVFDVVDVDVVDLDEAQAARVDPLVGEDDTDLDDEYEDEDGEFEESGGFDILDDDDEYDADSEYDDGAYDEETDVVEPEEESTPKPKPRELRGRGGFAPGHVQAREEAAYRERRRILAALSLVTLVSIVTAFFVQPLGYVAVGVVVAVFAAYLFFLRRTVRIEQQRHAQRRARQRRREVEEARVRREQAEPLYVAPPARLRRPGGAIVLEIDDEDPAFDHLPTYDFSGAYRYEDTDLDADLGDHRAAV